MSCEFECKCDIADCHYKERTEDMKKALTTRLNRIEGQIRGIKGMIDNNVYCDDIINQITAAQSALNSVKKVILEDHMKSCVIERIKAGEDEVVDELLKTIGRML